VLLVLLLLLLLLLRYVAADIGRVKRQPTGLWST
jgi:hypothetical protein